VCLEVYFHTSCKSLSCCRETERERERGYSEVCLHRNDWKVLKGKTVYHVKTRQCLVHFNNIFYLEER